MMLTFCLKPLILPVEAKSKYFSKLLLADNVVSQGKNDVQYTNIHNCSVWDEVKFSKLWQVNCVFNIGIVCSYSRVR